MKTLVIDNALPENLYFFLKNAITSHNYDWNYIRKTATSKDEESLDQGSFAKRIFEINSEERCITFPYFHSALMDITNKANIKSYELIRIKAALFPHKNYKLIYPAHVDYHTFEHTTILLYFNSLVNDGETLIYKNRYGEEFQYLELEDSIEPKENRVVIFDGLKFHSTTAPTTSSDRTIVNFNIKV